MTPLSKFAMYALVVIATVTGALWFVGGKKKECSTEVTLNATPQEVFVFLSTPKYLKQWISGLQEMDLIDTPEGQSPMYEIVMLDKGRKVTLRQEVIKYAQDSMIALQNKSDSLVSTAIFRLEEAGEDKTKLSYKVKEEGKGLARVLIPLNKNPTQERIREECRMLKRVIEENLDKLELESPVSPMNDATTPEEEPVPGS